MVYRAGLIGCGGVSRDHSKGLQAARGVELVALADVYEPICVWRRGRTASSAPTPIIGR